MVIVPLLGPHMERHQYSVQKLMMLGCNKLLTASLDTSREYFYILILISNLIFITTTINTIVHCPSLFGVAVNFY